MTNGRVSRRRFLATTAAAGAAASGLRIGARADERAGRGVAIICDPEDAVCKSRPAQWALGELRRVLEQKRVAVRMCGRTADAQPHEFCVLAASTSSPELKIVLEKTGEKIPDAAETVALASAGVDGRPTFFACGSDARGLMYALLEAADRVRHSDPPLAALEAQKPLIEQPANKIRSIGRLFVSDVADLPWFRDKAFWKDYLTMLATERFNRFNLTLGLGYDFATDVRDSYFYFPYPFFLHVEGYDVRAVKLPDRERDENLAMLRFISDEAASRGIDFQLGLWSHVYQWANSPNANYTIEDLTPGNHAAYCRDGLAAVLKACSAITGVTLRTHGESGVTEGSYDFWESIFDGVVKSGRKVEIDLHAKGIDRQIIDAAISTGMPVVVSPKYWAEHTGLPYQQASIRNLEKPKSADEKGKGLFALSNGLRRFMRYSYGDLLREDRKYGVIFRMWPGSMKLLLWGDPEQAAAWGRYASFCGSQGMEIFEPLSFKGKQGSGQSGGRNGYHDPALKPKWDWEKYAYSYRLWGRLLYNPETKPEAWRRMLRTHWSAAAAAGESALAASSKIIPLITSAHVPSAANNNYWPEMYTNMSLLEASAGSPYGDTPSPKRFGTVSPLDPEIFATVEDSAKDSLRAKADAKYSPAEAAVWLDDVAERAATQLDELRGAVNVDRNPELRRLAIDVQLQIGLGRFFASKFRAAVLFAIYKQSGDGRRVLEEAAKQYRAARDAWKEVAKLADGIYVDITFGPSKQLRGNWSDRIAAIQEDIDLIEKQLSSGSGKESNSDSTVSANQIAAAIRSIYSPPKRPDFGCSHEPPKSLQPGKAVEIVLSAGNDESMRPANVQVRYRRVDQSQDWESIAMELVADGWRGRIPAAYTASPFPLQYYFVCATKDGACSQYPGLGDNLCAQPYFVVRQKTAS